MVIIKKDVIVIGAGAAGLMCAIEAGKRGRSVLVLDHSKKTGSKILISGGGRCNFTNQYAGPRDYTSQNPHFCKSALARFSAHDFIALVERNKIKYHEKKDGQLFCDDGSEAIIRLLEKECRRAKAEIKLNCPVSEIEKNDCFNIHSGRRIFQSQSLVIATGGLSFPKIGASAFGYNIAKKFGLHVIPCRPALVPLTWGRKDIDVFGGLAGVSLDAIAHYGKHSFHDQILFTHKGLSGPAILQVSTYWEEGTPIVIDILEQYLPRRFVQKWASLIIPSKPLNQCSDLLHNWQVTPDGTEGYDKAEVTAGGVDTAECSSKTMESKKVPGLYFIGEVLDVTGHLGGYNLQWAWSSGFAAGQFV